MATELEDKQGNTSIATPDPGQAYSDRKFNGITGADNMSKDGEDPFDNLNDQENKAGSQPADSSTGLSSAKELSNAESLYGGNRSDKDSGTDTTDDNGRFLSAKRIGNFFSSNKKKTIGGGIVGLIVGGGIFGSTLLSGPLQFIHFAQNLQKFHFSEKGDFDNDRSSKVLIYAMLGNTAKGRLGVTGNVAADKWEERLLKETGMRPVFSQPGGRFVGFEIQDGDKAASTLGGANEKDTKRLEAIAGKGADFTTVGEISGRQPIQGIDGKPLDKNTRILDLRNVSLKDRRLMTRVIGRQTGTNGIVSSVGSRLMIKRGGIDFHPLKNVARNKSESLLDYREKRRQARNAPISSGIVPPAGVEAGSSGVDADGKPITDSVDSQAAQATKDAIAEAQKADSKALSGIKTGLTAAKGPAVVIGLLCAVKGIGDGAEAFKYDNTMKLMRYGASYLTVASQVMSGQGLNLDELGALSETLYDEESGLGWDSAKSIQAENGETQSGPDIAKESIPSSSDDQRDIFKVINGISPLGPVCDTINKVGGLPIIKQISTIISKGTEAVINPFLGAATGYTLDSLGAAAIALVAGKGIDLDATGPAAGNLANYGARLMANDQFVSTGARPLTSSEELALKNLQINEPNQSIAQRYFDPYLATSLTGKMVDTLPINASQAGFMLRTSVTNFGSTFKSAFTRITIPKTSAAAEYNYGFPKFGYSEAEQNDERFEDPYKNQNIMQAELDGRKASEQSCAERERAKGRSPYPTCEQGYSSLYELNTGDSDFSPNDGDGENKEGSDEILTPYGRKCFSSEVDDAGSIKTGESINMSTLPKNCSDQKEIFLRYRFYIADTITTKSLACFEARDTAACTELGFGASLGATDDTAAAPGGVGGSTQVVGDIGHNSDNVPCAAGTKDLGVVTSQYNGASKKETGDLRIRICQISSISGSGQDTAGNRISGGVVQNSRVAGAWQALGEKAKKENIQLDGSSSFRLRSSCGGGGDGRRCATANGSMHQLGVAIDFSSPKGINTNAQDCVSRVRDKGNPTWEWLNKNAAAFGFKQYSAEAWHWDALQAGNRCGGDGS